MLILSSKDWSIRGIPRLLHHFLYRNRSKGPSRLSPQSYFTLFRSLQVQPKQRLRQTVTSGNQEKRGERRKKEAKDSNLDLSRMDVKEVSSFKTHATIICCLPAFEHLTQSHSFVHGSTWLSLFICPSVYGQNSFGAAPHCSVIYLFPQRLMCLIHLDTDVSRSTSCPSWSIGKGHWWWLVHNKSRRGAEAA